MGCTMTTPQVDGDKAPANNTPSRLGLFKRQVPSPNHSTEKLALKTGLLSKEGGGEEFEPGSPSFRCYVRKEDMQMDENDVVANICEQRHGNSVNVNNSSKRESSRRQNEGARSPNSNQERKAKAPKKEKGWMPKVFSKGNTTPTHQSNN